ncbi:MAG: HDOD domain-containing protein [Betaproteobacteria bacterium]|jgi:HD-like signal output (HDOD) protein|nr:HDOD domain-containing protein [Burkholderiaceae bacterium]MCZ8151212.1 HDOD domain-containing protein [Paracoccaceae bacterium]MCZ8177090.1 HDOD domain-containing protein [Burkholderiaceae bacterium]
MQPLVRIDQPPRDLPGWAALFRPQALPVLAATAARLAELREHEDAVDAHLLAEVVAADPLLTLKLLAHVGHLLRNRETSQVETVTAALVMLGIPPFFRQFGEFTVAEDALADLPDALEGFRGVLRRSHRAARFAIGFAVHRMDYDAPLIHEAALLHDFAELLLWLHAPAMALRIASLQAADSTLRSATVQREVLGIELVDLQHTLMERWRLPGLVVQLTDDHAARSTPQMRNVLLAIRVARHSAAGWDNAAIPDDVRDIAELLQLSPDATKRLLHEIGSD